LPDEKNKTRARMIPNHVHGNKFSKLVHEKANTQGAIRTNPKYNPIKLKIALKNVKPPARAWQEDECQSAKNKS